MSAESGRVERWVKRFVVAAIVLAVGSIVGFLVITPRPAEIDSAAVLAAEEASLRRSIDAYAARYTGMAENYLAGSHSSLRAMDAYAARYTGMAARYTTKSHSSQRAIDAYAARCNGLAEHYAATGK